MVGAVIAVILVLASGGLMLATGVMVEDGDSQGARIASLAAGVVAPIGFVFARRAEPAVPAADRRRPDWLLLALAIALSFVSGGLMFAAGYLAARGYWYLTPLLALQAGSVIVGCYLLDWRARRG